MYGMAPVTSWHSGLSHVPTRFVTGRREEALRRPSIGVRSAALQDIQRRGRLCRRRKDGFAGADKSAHELAIDQWSNRVHVHSLAGQEGPRVFDLVNTCGLDADGFKARSR